MKNYAVLEGMKRSQKTVLNCAFNKGYEQGYKDGKEDKEQEYATALHDIEDTYIKRQKAEYEGSYEDEDGKKYPFKDAAIWDVAYMKGLQHGHELRAEEVKCAEACGMKRAWQAVRKIIDMPLADLDQVFPGWDVEHIIEKLSAKEVIEKIDAWEKEQKENEKVDCNNTDCKNCINHNDCDYEDEKQEQTEKNCKECEIYSKALSGKFTVKQIKENCDTCNNFSNVKPFEGCTLKECYYEPKQEQTKKTCDTCEHGEAYKQGSDITTMDDECGGCCSWNNKWTPKEDTIGNSVKSIGFGDEVVDNLGHVMMVTDIAVESKCADVLKSDGTTDQMPLEILEKTGKHYDIQALLDAMKSEKTEEGGENVHE